MVGWVEMQPVVDNIIFTGQDEPGFDRHEAWRPTLEAMSGLKPRPDILMDFGDTHRFQGEDLPLVRWWCYIL